METFEIEEGPNAYLSLTQLGKLTQVWVYIGKIQNNKTIKFHYGIS